MNITRYREGKIDEIVDLFMEVFENEPWNEFFIKEFFIKMNTQGAGVGSEILYFLEDSLAQKDIETSILLIKKCTHFYIL
ncbi:MAG: hypothetical protein R6V14_05440 [Halanaerobiales bacterium]